MWDDLRSLENRIIDFKKILVDAFDEHCNSGLHALKYHLFLHIVAHI